MATAARHPAPACWFLRRAHAAHAAARPRAPPEPEPACHPTTGR